MKINVMLMKPQAYNTLQKHYQEVYALVRKNPDSGEWLREYLGYDPFDVTKYEVDDFELKYDRYYDSYSVPNGITLYEHLKMLPSYILYNQYFWCWIIFAKAYRQAQHTVEFINAKTLLRTWFPPTGSRRGIMDQAMAQEDVKAKMTVDVDSGNKYELTKYLFANKSLFIFMMARNVTDNSAVSLAVVDIAKEIFDRKGQLLSRDQSEDLLKSTYRLGSAKLIDSMSREEIKESLTNELMKDYPQLYV